MSEKRLLDSFGFEPRLLIECVESHNDARGAESALASTSGTHRFPPCSGALWVEPVDRRDRLAFHTPSWRHTRHPWLPVDEDSAATALALRTAAILDRTNSRVGQNVEKGLARLDKSH